MILIWEDLLKPAMRLILPAPSIRFLKHLKRFHAIIVAIVVGIPRQGTLILQVTEHDFTRGTFTR